MLHDVGVVLIILVAQWDHGNSRSQPITGTAEYFLWGPIKSVITRNKWGIESDNSSPPNF